MARARAVSRCRRGAVPAGILAASAAALLTGCGNGTSVPTLAAPAGAARLDAADQPRTIGRGPRFLPGALGRDVSTGAAVHGRSGTLRCTSMTASRYGAHLELFAGGHVVVIPAGIGIAPPQRRQGAFVTGGRCSYPLRTVEPTGVIQVAPAPGARASPPLLGDLFAEWAQPLSARRLAGFTAGGRSHVVAFVDGRPWSGTLGAIPLIRHTQIVLEVNGAVLPHRRYRFEAGL